MAGEFYGIDYGGPATGIVHQDRLVLAGSIGVPDLVMASKIRDWTNFGLTRDVEGTDTATDADGFFFLQSTSRNNGFQSILQQEGLFLFGSIGEATIPAGPFTSGSVEIRENSWFGSEPGRQPIIVKGLVVFAQRGGRDVRGIQWTEQARKYEVPSLVELTGDIFTIASRREGLVERSPEGRLLDLSSIGSDGVHSPRVLTVSDNGQLQVMHIRDEQPAIAWTTHETDGVFLGVASVQDEAVFLVERDGEVGFEYWDVREDGAPLLDVPRELGDTPIPRPTNEELWAFDPEQMDGDRFWSPVVWPDDATMLEKIGTRIVWRTDEGANTFRDAGVSSSGFIRIGRPYATFVETMPFVARTQTGPRLSILRSRIYGLVCSFAGKAPPSVWIRRRSYTSPSEVQGDEPRSERGTVNQVRRFGSLSGWRRRTTIDLEFRQHCTLASISYRASG